MKTVDIAIIVMNADVVFSRNNVKMINLAISNNKPPTSVRFETSKQTLG